MSTFKKGCPAHINELIKIAIENGSRTARISGIFAVRIGDMHMYGSRHCTKDETYGISVKNIYGCGNAAPAIAGEIGNLVIYGVECAEGTKMFYDWPNSQHV